MVVRKVKQLFQQEKGATALYFAMVLFLLLGMGSIALDGSNLYVQRSRMQTAADAATLAGANVLALGGDTAAIDAEVKSMAMANGVGDVPWTIGSDGKSIQASAPSDLDVDWSYTNDNKDIEVSVANEHETFFAGLLGYDTLTTTGVSKAGHEPIVSVDNLIDITVNGCDCLDFDQFPVSITKEDFAGYITAVYQIDDVNNASVDYTMFLKNLDSAYPGTSANRPYYMFYNADTNGTFTEYGDNTAQAVQSVVNVNGDGFMVDLRYSGRTATAPDGDSPNCGGTCSNTTDWYYYATTTGLLTGLPGTRYEGAIIQVTRRDSSMQVGTNAHLKSPQPDYGAAGWLTLDVLQQPTTGVTLASHSEDAENNMTLSLPEEEEEVTCDLYPIALASTTLTTAVVGVTLPTIWNGVQPGNFGWLTWAGSPNVPTLATSLTPPGDSDTYVNPNNAADTLVSVGDWVQGSPGVSNASNVRSALDTLKTMDIIVPVWDQASGTGNNSLYRVSAFAIVRITDYRLPNQNRITATFKGYATGCGVEPSPTPTPTPTPPPTGKKPCELAWLDWDGGIASDGETVDYLNNLGLSGTWSVGDTVPAGPEVEHVQQVANALDEWLNKPVTMVFYDDGDQENGYQICGFAEFTMTDYDFTALPKWLQGEFNLGTVRGVTDPNAPDYGLRGIRFH